MCIRDSYETVYADQNPNWLNQDLGIFPTSSSLVPGIAKASDFELATLRYPVAKDAVDPGILVTPSVFLTISANSKHPDVAEMCIRDRGGVELTSLRPG